MSSANTRSTSTKSRTLRERCGFNFTLKLSPPRFRPDTVAPNPYNLPQAAPTKPQANSGAAAVQAPVGPGPLGPRAGNLPRRKPKPKPVHVNQFAALDNPPLVNSNAVYPPPPNVNEKYTPIPLRLNHNKIPLSLTSYLSPPPRFVGKDESRCLQQIIPGLFVAFEDDNVAWSRTVVCPGSDDSNTSSSDHGSSTLTNTTKDSLEPPAGQEWTHTISITRPPPKIDPCGHNFGPKCTCFPAEDDDDGEVIHDEITRTLHLILPPSPYAITLPSTPRSFCLAYSPSLEDIEDDPLSLKSNQLLAARDFLSFYGHSLTFRTTDDLASTPLEPPVRILITTPRNHRAEAMALVTSYLAFAFNKRVDRVLDEIDRKRDCLSVWKTAVGPQAEVTVERVVRI